MSGVYFCVEAHYAADDAVELLGTGGVERVADGRAAGVEAKPHQRLEASGARWTGPNRWLEVVMAGKTELTVRRDHWDWPTRLNDPSIRQKFVVESADDAGMQVYFKLLPADAAPGEQAEVTFTIRAGARRPSDVVQLVLDATKPGRAFDGIGGNFRLQFPATDPAVIEYNLDHLPVAWSRVAMPWIEWDRDETQDPLALARSGTLDQRVHEAMELARELARRRIPVIVSAWGPPMWARALNQPPGLRGTALNPDKLERVYGSIASYLVFLKEHYGVEATYFSLNEPEIGVEVRQTATEHLEFLKGLGPHLAVQGLTTKLLLGDTAHATPSALEFLKPTLADPSVHGFIGALAFHTWRGCLEETLGAWAEAARRLGVPLLVTEAGPDAHLHVYPAVMLEPWFQLQEIDLYLRVCAYSQPASIMHWQLTADYSLLWGAGIYGSDGPLRPTQRFWNLKQLGLTPPGAMHLPISCDSPTVTAAAFGDLVNGQFAIHLANRGGDRRVRLAGLPASVSEWRVYWTDAQRGMEAGGQVDVRSGMTEFDLPGASYVTLLVR
jgi:hypothetical protein